MHCGTLFQISSEVIRKCSACERLRRLFTGNSPPDNVRLLLGCRADFRLNLRLDLDLSAGAHAATPSAAQATSSGPAGCRPSWETSTPGVFVAGDVHKGASLIVWAIAGGRAAAAAVHAYLGGRFASSGAAVDSFRLAVASSLALAVRCRHCQRARRRPPRWPVGHGATVRRVLQTARTTSPGAASHTCVRPRGRGPRVGRYRSSKFSSLSLRWSCPR